MQSIAQMCPHTASHWETPVRCLKFDHLRFTGCSLDLSIVKVHFCGTKQSVVVGDLGTILLPHCFHLKIPWSSLPYSIALGVRKM